MNCNQEGACSTKSLDRILSYGGTPVRIPCAYYYDEGIAIDILMEVTDEDAQSYAKEIKSSGQQLSCEDFLGANSPFASIEAVLQSRSGQYTEAESSVCIIWKGPDWFDTKGMEGEEAKKWKQKYTFIPDLKHHVMCQHAYFRVRGVNPEETLSVIFKGRRFSIFPHRTFDLSVGAQDDVYADIKDVRRDKDIRVYIDEIRLRRLSKRLTEAVGREDAKLYGLTVHYETDEEMPLSLYFAVDNSEKADIPVYGNILEGKGSHGYDKYAVNAGIVDAQQNTVSITLTRLSVKLFDDREFKLA